MCRNRVIIALVFTTAIACSKKPEERLVSEITALSKLVKAHREKPVEAARALRAHLHDRLPAVARALGDAVSELDRIDNPVRRSARLDEMIGALETPVEQLMVVLALLGDSALADAELAKYVDEMIAVWLDTSVILGHRGIETSLLTYSRRLKTAEAYDELDRLYRSSSSYFVAPQVEPGTGRRIECQFPRGTGPTPPTSAGCCGGLRDSDGDRRCDVDATQWADSTWSTLKFQMNKQHFFSYQYESSGTAAHAAFTASAFADLDCDGVFSTFQRYGYADKSSGASECSMMGSSAFFKYNETE